MATWRYRQQRECHVTTRQILELCSYKPRNAKDCQQTTRSWKEARKDVCSTGFGGSTALPNLNFGLPASRSETMNAFLFSFFFFFRAETAAYRNAKSRGSNRSRSHWPMPQPHGIWVASVTYTTAHGNIRSLTHWARPGIKPTSSWILVRFISAEPPQGLPNFCCFKPPGS